MPTCITTNFLNMLNTVEIPENIPLGYGLDYRADRNEVSEAATQQIYCRFDNIGSTEYPIDDITQDYYFPTAAETMQISSSNNSDNQNLTLYYYGSTADEEPTSQNITLNGQTAVTLSSDVFRISRLVCAGSNNAGTVYLYKSGETLTAGVPAGNILCVMKPNTGFSEQSHFYVPKSWTAYLTKIDIISNAVDTILSTRSMELTAYRLLSYAAPSLRYKVQVIPVHTPLISIQEDSAPGLGENTTYLIKAKRTAGTNAQMTVTYRFVFLK